MNSNSTPPYGRDRRWQRDALDGILEARVIDARTGTLLSDGIRIIDASARGVGCILKTALEKSQLIRLETASGQNFTFEVVNTSVHLGMPDTFRYGLFLRTEGVDFTEVIDSQGLSSSLPTVA